MYDVANNDDVMDMFGAIVSYSLDCSNAQLDENWPDGLFSFMVMANGKILD